MFIEQCRSNIVYYIQYMFIGPCRSNIVCNIQYMSFGSCRSIEYYIVWLVYGV